jgi:hypothetical protein
LRADRSTFSGAGFQSLLFDSLVDPIAEELSSSCKDDAQVVIMFRNYLFVIMEAMPP